MVFFFSRSVACALYVEAMMIPLVIWHVKCILRCCFASAEQPVTVFVGCWIICEIIYQEHNSDYDAYTESSHLETLLN